MQGEEAENSGSSDSIDIPAVVSVCIEKSSKYFFFLDFFYV